MWLRRAVGTLLAALAVLSAACDRSETKAERCSAARERYLHLIDERLQEASELVPITNEDDGLSRLLTRYQGIILPRASGDFAAACEALDVEALARCVELEVKCFEKHEADVRALGLDLDRPWLMRSGDPACRPIFEELERRLFGPPRPASGRRRQ